ncbi:putative 75k gamma secalin protein [Phaeoacremonium minimum UCRPA7]|uniref:Putative 75k gamma secalin protein n=1 Tax=Phaeoacremonium minimum (strain UCR-PA7) TaxID=1286976 RepID=R8BQ92_PHAM7|nr:putative 75k gamma secalin protein [Phaeoacremonium minimum UCRPA7]EOO01504.1 putative 75k gamma secalin protein [Phaeoacremonium minimum UCRPA7]
MEAETALTKGIALCEKHRFQDLKYSMQFLLLKVLFRRNRKAAFIAVDKQISESLTYKQIQWVYAFRFLRASFSLQSGTPADAPALENLRSISGIASHRQDRAIFMVTALLEGLTHLKSRKADSIVRVQTCIAEASKFQSDPSFHIPQLEVLRLLLDLACDLQEKNPGGSLSKMKALQARMDELIKTSDWDASLTELVLPMKKQSGLSQTISEDTGTILRPGRDDHDFLVLSFVTKLQAFVLAYCFSGVALLYKSSTSMTSSELWEEALGMLAKSHTQMRGRPASLQGAIEHVDWAGEVSSYIYILIGLTSATHSNWSKAKECIDKVENNKSPLGQTLELLALYLSGCYYQGVAKLDQALQIFEDPRFNIDGSAAAFGGSEPGPAEVSVLAALNRLWIMQEPSHRDDYKTAELIEQLRPYCMDSPNKEIQIAWNLVLAAIHTNPALSINQVKKHIQEGLKSSQHTNNTHCLSIALNIMRYRLFENVVGDQAVKSARAGSVQAEKSGNLLWMSVADGMLSQSYEMQGAVAEAQAKRESGTRFANEALAKTMS